MSSIPRIHKGKIIKKCIQCPFCSHTHDYFCNKLHRSIDYRYGFYPVQETAYFCELPKAPREDNE